MSGIVSGTLGADTLASAGAATFYGDSVVAGLAEAATFAGGAGDTITGSDFNDLVFGQGGADSIRGDAGVPSPGEGNDTIYGGAGNDTILGGDGNDCIEGGTGADNLDGGAGTDILSYVNSSAGVSVVFNGFPSAGGDAAGDTLAGFEVVLGSNATDDIRGGAGAETLAGNGGDDVLFGSLGADSLDGGDGTLDSVNYFFSSVGVQVDLTTGLGSGGAAQDDTLAGFERVFGSDFADSIIGHDSNVSLDGGFGDDTLVGGSGRDVLRGFNGADSLDGGAGHDVASYTGDTGVHVNLATGIGLGGEAAGDNLANIEEVLVLASGSSTLIGNDADNILTTSFFGSGDSMSGAGGNDSLSSSSGNDMLAGGSDNDTLDGGTGNDTITGDAGDDLVVGGSGADSLDGGDGFDIVSYAGVGSAVRVDLGASTASGGDAAGDTIAGFEGVIGSTGADTLVGNATDNLLAGRGGADSLDGGDGDFDFADYRESSTGVEVNLATGEGAGGEAHGDRLANIEGLFGSTLAGDTLTGNGAANLIFGGGGGDSLSGGDSDDQLFGEEGSDTIEGGAGNDALDGGLGTNVLSYANSVDPVLVDLGNGTASGGDGEGDFVSNFSAVLGTGGADTLIGNGDDNTLEGGSGNDSLEGGLGNDSLSGGDGNDSISSGNTNDSLDGGTGNDALTVAGGNNTVFGDDGDDLIVVGTGTGDNLDGAFNNDTLAFAFTGEVTLTGVADNFTYATSTGGGGSAQNFEFIRDTLGNDVSISSILAGGGVIAVCFAAGTRILTAQGEAAVETLRVGDLVATLGLKGAPVAPVLWVGRRRIALAGNPHAEALMPIRIRAGALGQGAPTRDLLVSPDHCLFLDGALVPARLLVNGGTIVVERGLAEVTYFHVELDRHDVLIAEGAAAESWLDAGNRDWFANADVALLNVAAMPDAYATSQPEPCAPVVQGGPRLAAIRDAAALVAARERRRAVA
jgi:Ca2+-binding RTX toxin-like protein